MFELVNEYNQNAVIKVIGVGGGGGNAVMSMLESKIHGAEFILANTDSQALRDVKGATMIQIGSEITKGLGAGADPEKGRQAALEAKEELASAIEGTDMLFIAAGMGGGTGTGAASVIAQIARDAGVLTVAVVTKPYEFEGAKRMLHADQGIEALSEWVDSLIVIPNEKLSEVYGGENSIFSSCSINVTFLAPLEIHSIPNDPTPENKSKILELSILTLNLLEWTKILKIDSLVKSLSGLVLRSFGSRIFLPFELPEIILIYLLLDIQYLFDKSHYPNLMN